MKHVQSDLKFLGLSTSVVALGLAFAWSGGIGDGPETVPALAGAPAAVAQAASSEPDDLAAAALMTEVTAVHRRAAVEESAGDPRVAHASAEATTVPEWKDVEEGFRDIIQITENERTNMLEALLGGPVVPTEEWLLQRIGVDASEETLAKAWILVNERNLQIQWESRQYYDLLAQKVRQKWDDGAYRKAQGALPPDPEASSGYYITQVAHNGWLASVHVGAEDGADLEEEYQRLRTMIRSRNRELISLAKGG